jgi:diguanylate cyclase (GGDEF)-like protein
MLKGKSREAVLLSLAPAAALGLGTFFHWRGEEHAPTLLVSILATMGSLSGVVALAFAADALRLRRALAHLRSNGGALGDGRRAALEASRLAEVGRLQHEVERLAAVRDLALIANDDVDWERVLERALGVIDGLFEPHEVRVHLVKEGGKVEPAVVRSKGTTTFRKDGAPLQAPIRRAQRALSSRRTLAELRTRALDLATLLVADGEVIGVLEVAIPRRDRDAAWARDAQRDIEAIAKHIALAIRKPTLYDRAVMDALTGLGTKRHFLEQAKLSLHQAKRLKTPLSLVAIDIDHFKRVNDEHGHVAGDLVLAEVARRVRSTIRGYDAAFRYGGEEIIVLASNTKLEEGKALAERLRRVINSTPIPVSETKSLTVGASFGVAELDPSMKEVSSLVEAADKWLYVAKGNGRNQVQPPPVPLAIATPVATPAPPVVGTA